MSKIFGKPARPTSACFELSGPGAPVLSRIKASPSIIAAETIRSRAGQTTPRRCPDKGLQMGLFGHRHAWRAACSHAAWPGSGRSTDLARGHAGSCRNRWNVAEPSAEPFGLSASPCLRAACATNGWRVARKLDDERVQLALCDGDREHCASPAALQFLAIVDSGRTRDGRARLGEINRAINLAIRPMSDLAQYGEIDVWTSPLVTFDARRRRLRRLRDREIRRPAPGRHRRRTICAS